MNSLIQLVGWTLLHFLWQGCILGVALAAALFCARKNDARVRYALCCAAMLSLALCPIGTFLTLSGSLSPSAEPAIRAQVSPHPVTNATVAQSPISNLVSTAPPMQPANWPEAVVAIWAIGVAVLSVRTLGGLWVVERLRRRWSEPGPSEWQHKMDALQSALGMSRNVVLLLSERVRVPSTVGVFRAVVILPASFLARFPAEQVEILLLHELAHVRRHDYLVNLVQSCVEAFLFYHPVVWWVSHVLRTEREHCCDEIVIRSTGNGRLYARALAQLEQHLSQVPHLSMSARGGQLMNRVARILSTKQLQRKSVAVWPSVIALTALAVGLGETVHAQAEAHHPKPQRHSRKHSPAKAKHAPAARTDQQILIDSDPSALFKSMAVSSQPVIVDSTQAVLATALSDVLVSEKPAAKTAVKDITLQLEHGSLNDALKAINKQVGFSYVLLPTDPMHGIGFHPITANLVHKSLTQAIQAVCASAGATFRVDGGTYYIEVRGMKMTAPPAGRGFGGFFGEGASGGFATSPLVPGKPGSLGGPSNPFAGLGRLAVPSPASPPSAFGGSQFGGQNGGLGSAAPSGGLGGGSFGGGQGGGFGLTPPAPPTGFGGGQGGGLGAPPPAMPLGGLGGGNFALPTPAAPSGGLGGRSFGGGQGGGFGSTAPSGGLGQLLPGNKPSQTGRLFFAPSPGGAQGRAWANNLGWSQVDVSAIKNKAGHFKLNMVGASVVSAVTALAKASGQSIVVAPEAKVGTVDVIGQSFSFVQALQSICKSCGATYSMSDGIYTINRRDK